MNWYNLPVNDIYDRLTSGPQGLAVEVAKERLAQTGGNILKEGRHRSALALLLSQFKDTMIVILIIAAALSGLAGDFAETIAIFIIIAANALMGFLQEYRAERAVKALKDMAVSHAGVLRGGAGIRIPSTEVVPGDVLVLEAGSSVPADLRLTQAMGLKIEEAALTGEAEACEKQTETLSGENLPIGDRSNMAFRGTFVASGRGTGVVVATGMETELGHIASLLDEEEAQTPLQRRLAYFGKRLSLIVLFLCAVFFAGGWLRGENITTMLLTSISLAVAAIPEALPAVITISLALAARRMVRLHALVKKLPAIETLGSVSYICTDKTGTLTQNRMHVEEVFTDGKLYDAEALAQISSKELPSLLLHAFALNNDAVRQGNDLRGDSTEVALMELANAKGIQAGAWPRLAEIAFDSRRKLMTTFHKHGDRIIAFTKGAPEAVLGLCAGHDERLHLQIETMGRNGYRVIGFGYRYWDAVPDRPESNDYERGLRFLGLAAIIDPPREEVATAVTQCIKAGIVPVMITGDHPITAETIARRIGILRGEEDLVITGQQLAALDEEAFKAMVERVRVYARVSPEQKLQIVKALQQKGHYVAMTGDGVNDAPSLKIANIGIAMGITGTDVSKEAAHMVLLDDNFSTIVRAVREGRRVYDNILKFIKYLMTTNSSELLVLLAGPMLGLPVALGPLHILWINLVSDGLPAIALSYEKAERDIMDRQPRPPEESVFAKGRGIHMLWVGVLMAGVVLAVQGWSIAHGLSWQTIVFNVLSLSQMGHLLAIRSNRTFFRSGLHANWRLWAAVLLVFALQSVITYVPAAQRVFHTEALSFTEFLLVAMLSTIVFAAVEIEKALFNRKQAMGKLK